MANEPKARDRFEDRRWISTGDLPAELRARIETDPTLEIRGPGTRSGLVITLLLPLGVAALIAGVLCGLLVPDKVVGDPYRWSTLVVGGLALGVWIAWRRAPSLRPFKGQGLYVGPTSLIVIDHTSIEVIPAERLEQQERAILCDGKVVDRGAHQHVFDEALAAAIAAASGDEEARWQDPWRRAATDARALPGPTSNLGKLIVGGGVGLALALALEAGAGVLGASATARSADKWSTITGRLTEQLHEVSRGERAEHERRLATAESTLDLLPVLEALAGYDVGDERRKAIIDRFSELAVAELAAAPTAEETLGLIGVSRSFGLDDVVGHQARARFVELARVEIGAAEAAEDVTWILGVDSQFGLDAGFVGEARARFAVLARARMATASTRYELLPLVEAVTGFDLGDDMKHEVTERFAALAVAELARTSSTTELDAFYTDGLELALGEPYLQTVRSRYIAVARHEMRAARSATSIAGLFGAVRSWQLGDDLLAELVARYESLAARDIAAATSLSSLEQFIGAEDQYGLSDGFERRVLEPRVAALIRRDIDRAKSPADVAGVFIALADFDGPADLRDRAQARYLELGAKSIASARAFLGWQGFEYMDETQVLISELDTMCKHYPERTTGGASVPQLYTALLTGLCDEVPASLTYRLTSNTDDHLGEQGAAAFRSILYDTSVALGAPIDFRFYANKGAGDVLMSVTASGEPRPSAKRPGATERDCTIKLTLQGSAGHRGTGLSETIDVVCVGMPEDDLE